MFYFSLFLLIWAAPALLLLSFGAWAILRAARFRARARREAARAAGEASQGKGW